FSSSRTRYATILALRGRVQSSEANVGSRWRTLALLAIAELLGMSLWFSGSAVVPALTREWRLSETAAGWLTLSVQIGFVVGTLLSALFNLPDIISPRHLFTLTSLLGAIANAAFGWFAPSAAVGLTLRFFTGMFIPAV